MIFNKSSALVFRYFNVNQVIMINEYTKSDCSEILHVVNDAAARYKNAIPDDCWKEPYMSERELLDEFRDRVRMFGYIHDNKLIAVMGCCSDKACLYLDCIPGQRNRKYIARISI